MIVENPDLSYFTTAPALGDCHPHPRFVHIPFEVFYILHVKRTNNIARSEDDHGLWQAAVHDVRPLHNSRAAISEAPRRRERAVSARVQEYIATLLRMRGPATRDGAACSSSPEQPELRRQILAIAQASRRRRRFIPAAASSPLINRG